jgi:hypothetical protein
MDGETSLAFGLGRAKQDCDCYHRRRGCNHDQREYQPGSNILSFRDSANLFAWSEGNGEPYQEQRNEGVNIVACQRNSPECVRSKDDGDRRCNHQAQSNALVGVQSSDRCYCAHHPATERKAADLRKLNSILPGSRCGTRAFYLPLCLIRNPHAQSGKKINQRSEF